jgi:hypothetical protein
MCNPKSYQWLHSCCLCRLIDVEVTVEVGVKVRARVVVGVGVRDRDHDRLGPSLFRAWVRELWPRLPLAIFDAGESAVTAAPLFAGSCKWSTRWEGEWEAEGKGMGSRVLVRL